MWTVGVDFRSTRTILQFADIKVRATVTRASRNTPKRVMASLPRRLFENLAPWQSHKSRLTLYTSDNSTSGRNLNHEKRPRIDCHARFSLDTRYDDSFIPRRSVSYCYSTSSSYLSPPVFAISEGFPIFKKLRWRRQSSILAVVYYN